MSDLVKSFKCGSTIAAQRIVSFVTGTAFSVEFADTTSAHRIGVTLDQSRGPSSSDQSVPVALDGEHKVMFNDTCTSGGLVSSDSNGKAVPYEAASVGAAYVGYLVDTSVAATGTIAKILVKPGIGFSS